jgi:hypothetical protein
VEVVLVVLEPLEIQYQDMVATVVLGFPQALQARLLAGLAAVAVAHILQKPVVELVQMVVETEANRAVTVEAEPPTRVVVEAVVATCQQVLEVTAAPVS